MAIKQDQQALADLKDDYKFGFSQPERYVFKARKGLNHDIVDQISVMKGEPDWMRQFRHKALDIFFSRPIPTWGPDLSDIDFDDIYYYIKPAESQSKSWDEVPDDIKETFDKLGIPEAERKFLAGAGAQYESEVVYHSLKEEWERQGVIFSSSDNGLREHEDIYREYFGTVVPPTDNTFAALNSAVWSGGSFVYVPKGVHLNIPLQAYFRINAQSMGQFERTLIIVEEGASVHYTEGCFLKGASIRTRDGEKAIEEIHEGDEVLTHRGRYRKVYHTMQRPYNGAIYHIRYFGDSAHELHVTEDHPLLVVPRQRAHERNRQFSSQWMTAAEVKQGDYLAIPVPHAEDAGSDAYRTTVALGRGRHAPVQREVSLPLEPDCFRLLGYYFSEGHVSNEHYLTFSFNVAEAEYLDDVKALLVRYFGKAPVGEPPRHNGQTLVLSSTQVARVFAQEFGSTVYEKHVPQWVQNAPNQHLAELIRGMWCGDGSYDPKKNMFRFNTISRDLAYAFRDALLRLGIAASVNIQHRDEPRQDIFAIVISSPWNSKFGEIVGRRVYDGRQSGSPFCLDGQYLYVPIRAIKIEEMETTVYNFSVEEDESYIGEGVVSHNCTAPIYASDSLHSGVIEIIVKKNARCRYSTIQNWSTNVYNLVTQRSLVYEGGTMEWVDANLGCLEQGSTVTTPEGIKPIEKLAVGEHVLSYDETSGQLCFHRVLAKRFSGNQPVHTISVGERKLRATANHPFYSYSYNANAPKKLGRYHLAYVRADHLKKAIVPCASLDYGKPYHLLKPVLVTEFNSRNQYADGLVMTRERQPRMVDIESTTDDIMWLFGYWLGDGDIQVKEGKTEGMIRWAKVGFSTPVTDRARDRLMRTMAMVIDAPPVERADGIHVTWCSKELAEFFRLNGFALGARDKRVPQWVWSLPESQRLSFVAGYLDADGYVQKPRRFTLKSVNRALLEDMASLLVTLGITSHLYTEFDEPRRVMIMGVECVAHGAYRLTFHRDERLLPYLSSALRKRAEECPPAQFEYHRSIGRSNIELPDAVQVVNVQVSEPSAETVPTWDIEVEGTGNFVSQGFIVHNSKLTMKYPAVYMLGEGAHGEILSMAFSGAGQHHDTGGKLIHAAPNTSSQLISKSISKDGGRASYRGLVKVTGKAHGAKSNVTCDALLLDERSRSDTYPYIEIDAEDVSVGHEASVSKIGEEQLFYLMSRGLSEEDASAMIVSGFIEPMVKELPMEYAIEMNRLIQLQMEGSVG